MYMYIYIYICIQFLYFLFVGFFYILLKVRHVADPVTCCPWDWIQVSAEAMGTGAGATCRTCTGGNENRPMGWAMTTSALSLQCRLHQNIHRSNFKMFRVILFSGINHSMNSLGDVTKVMRCRAPFPDRKLERLRTARAVGIFSISTWDVSWHCGLQVDVRPSPTPSCLIEVEWCLSLPLRHGCSIFRHLFVLLR